MIWSTRNVLPSVSHTCFILLSDSHPHAEDEMDVSPLNLGMIAAYYNISCGSCFSHLLALRADRQILRRDGRGLYALVEGTHETQGPSRSHFIFSRIRNYSYPSTRGEPPASHIRSCSCQARSSQLRGASLQDIPPSPGTLLTPSASTGPRGRSSAGAGESDEPSLGLR